MSLNEIANNPSSETKRIPEELKAQKLDVAVYGLWYGHNYGSIITYYALSKVLDDMGFTYAMIRNPLGAIVDANTLCRSHALRFAEKHYKITPVLRLNQMDQLNSMFNTFLIGSDQMWNYGLSRPYKQSYYFDFVEYGKNKIAYGTSFGRDPYNGPDEEKKVVGRNLKRFNAISVRDDFSQRICKEDFGVEATLVADPVFLCPKEKYEDLIREVTLKEHENPFIFAYILDPNPTMGESLRKLAAKAGKRVIVIYDQGRYARPHTMQDLSNLLGITEEDPIMVLDDVPVEEWLYFFRYADFVITDSFHGACFSLILKKNFLVMSNKRRGVGRFPFLLGELGLMNRMVDAPGKFVVRYNDLMANNQIQIDYSAVDSVLEKKKKFSWEWLSNAIKHPRALGPEEVLPMEIKILPPQMQRCFLTTGLMQISEIHQIVIPMDSRDTELVRFLNGREDFVIHSVANERLAICRAHELAASLKEPVAIAGISEAGLSGYLPGGTSDQYMKLPFIVVSGDSYKNAPGGQNTHPDFRKGAFAVGPVGSDGRFDAVKELYWAHRECLVNQAVEGRRPNKDCIAQIKNLFWKEITSFAYDNAELLLAAVEDFLKGAEYFLKSDAELTFKKYAKKNEKQIPLSEVDGYPNIEKESPYGYKALGVFSKLIYVCSINGHLLPEFLLRNEPQVIAFDQFFCPGKNFRRKKLIAVNAAERTASLREIDKKRGLELIKRFRSTMKNYKKNHLRIENEYKTTLPKVYAAEFWMTYLR